MFVLASSFMYEYSFFRTTLIYTWYCYILIFWNILQYCWWMQTVLPVKKMLNYVFYCLFCCLFRHRDRICDAFTDIEVWIGKNRTQVFGFHCAEMEKNVSKHFIHRPLVWVKVLLEQDYKSWKLKFPCILRLQPSIVFYDESIS